MNEKILNVTNLSVSFQTYAGEVQAVRDVSFELEEGEILSIVGESGSGKSVMTQSITKLIPAPPAVIKSGKVLFQGEDMIPLSHKQLSKIKGSQIGYIFQDPMTSLNPTIKIGKQITESLHKHKHLNKNESKKQAIELLRETGIPNPEKRFEQYPHEMSGGMRQRVMIAMAIACRPKLLIADEPTTALDVTIQSQILGILRELNQKHKMSLILITHDLGIVAGIAQKVMVMYGGKIIERGKCKDIFYNPQHPYTEALLRSVPRLDLDAEQKLEYIIGSPPDMLAPPKGCAFAPRCRYCMEICKHEYPQEFKIEEDHFTSCWLTHPEGKQVKEQLKNQPEGQVRCNG